MQLNSTLFRATLSGALAGLLFGFDTVVISGAIDALVRLYGLNPQEKGITVAIGLAGTVIGALGAGQVGQRLGSRATLRITALLYIASAIGGGLAWNWAAFMTFRFIGGLGIGASSVLGPVYIAEIAPARLRGRLVAAFQLNVVFGVMAAYISNYAIRTMHLGAAEWRLQVGIAVLPAAVFFSLLFGIPRSPRWLVSKNRLDDALAVLKMIGEPEPEAELADIQEALAQEHVTAHEPVFQWKYRYPLFLAITIGAFNQLAGINAILYYLNDIFAAAGFSQISSDQQAIAIGTTNFLFTIVGMSLIDRLGRKTLLLIGAAGCASCLAGVAWVFATQSHRGDLLWLLVVFIAFFSVSQGAVIWVYIGEVFPTAVRSKGQGVGSASHWFSDTLIALAFPVAVTMMSTATPFIFFAAATLVQFIVVAMFYPETKGQTLEQLQRKLMRA